MNQFSFREMNLAGVQAQVGGGGQLAVGEYIARVLEAKVEPTKAGNGHKLVVKLGDTNGAGVITDNINLSNPNPDATKIGRERLKALLVSGGHANPDQPGDVSTIKGLLVGIIVEAGDEYTDRNGNKKTGTQLKRSGAYVKPSQIKGATIPAGAEGGTPVGSGDPFADLGADASKLNF